MTAARAAEYSYTPVGESWPKAVSFPADDKKSDVIAATEVVMETAEYEEMFNLESFYWWFVARRALLDFIMHEAAAGLRDPVMLDVGCGTGINFSVMKKFGASFSADASEEALKFSRRRGVEDLVLSPVESLPFENSRFDVVTALDVLEHVDDDLVALDELKRTIKEGGLLIITVPAYGFLWSEHDEALHHRRRYAASELRNKLTLVGFNVERISYYITFLFFPILFVRFIQSVFKKSVHAKTSHIILPSWLNSMLIGILAFERFLLRWINFPFGVSLVCLARKSSANLSPLNRVQPLLHADDGAEAHFRM